MAKMVVKHGTKRPETKEEEFPLYWEIRYGRQYVGRKDEAELVLVDASGTEMWVVAILSDCGIEVETGLPVDFPLPTTPHGSIKVF